MNYFVGINAGGTKTDFVLTDENMTPLFNGSTRSCNMKKEGTGNASSLLDEIVDIILAEKKFEAASFAGICAGFAGGGRLADAEETRIKVISILKNKHKIDIPVIITTDALITLEGAFGGKEGIVLISGTGSIAFARDNKGILHRAGGFGRIIGDEGSGYSIGRKGLAAAARYFDSRAKENFPARAIKEHFNVDSSEALIKKVYEENFEPSSFAPYVISGAEANDEVCLKIMEEEAEELVVHIKAVKNYLGQSFRLCFSGGIVSTDNYFSRLVREKIAGRFPNAEIIEPELNPEMGAALLIKNKSGK